MESIKNKIMDQLRNSRNGRDFWEVSIMDIIKLALIIITIIYGYAELKSEVQNLKSLRENDKKDFKELLVDLKDEVKELRKDLQMLIKDQNTFNNKNTK